MDSLDFIIYAAPSYLAGSTHMLRTISSPSRPACDAASAASPSSIYDSISDGIWISMATIGIMLGLPSQLPALPSSSARCRSATAGLLLFTVLHCTLWLRLQLPARFPLCLWLPAGASCSRLRLPANPRLARRPWWALPL